MQGASRKGGSTAKQGGETESMAMDVRFRRDRVRLATQS